jgi:hypothetical protein
MLKKSLLLYASYNCYVHEICVLLEYYALVVVFVPVGAIYE